MKTKKILILPELSGNSPNACAYLRILSPLLEIVRSQEIKVVNATELGMTSQYEIYRLLDDVALISTHRTAPIQTLINRIIIELAAKRKIPIHWDLDDLPFVDGINEQIVSPILNLLNSAKEMKDNVTYTTVSTEYIRDELTNLGFSNVQIFRNSLPDGLWEPVTCGNQNTFLFYGLGGHQAGLEYLSNQLHKFNFKALQRSGIRVLVVGPFLGSLHPLIKRIDIPRGRFNYLSFAAWLPTVSSSMVGIIYHEDTPLNRGKSALKALEYSAMRMATLTNANQAVLSDEIRSYTQVFATSNIVEEMIDFVRDKDRIEQVSGAAFDYVQKQRLLSKDSNSMTNFYSEVLS